MSDVSTFFFGEKKQVRILIENINREPIDVTNARFDLYHGSELEASGECTVTKVNDYSCTVNALISPLIKCAAYDLVFKYEIYPEKLIYPCKIRVV